MTAYANFRHLARGGQSVVQDHSTLPDTSSPGVSITAFFGFQSYFDDSLLQTALAIQSKNAPIVDNDVAPMRKEQTPGYCIGLHPSSQTPVAVQPIVGGQTTSPQATILKPGQILRPHGRPGDRNGNFSGFNWGLPFGWLGGGVATLYVFPSPDADVAWPGETELIFHRQRMRLYTPATVSIPARAPFNWPLRFPWSQASRGPTPISQSGAAIIGVNPTRTLMSLRVPSLADSVDMRIYLQADNDFDLNELGTTVLTNVRFVDTQWNQFAATNATLATAATNFIQQYPVITAPTELTRIAADDGGVLLWSDDPDSELGADAFVDVVRYGRL